MSHVLHRSLKGSIPVAARVNGLEITDRDGRVYLDASGGAAVSSLGHAHPAVLSAIRQQLDVVAYCHTSFFTTDAAEELASILAESAPQGLTHVFQTSSGSEAVEAALKLARQYFVEIGAPQRRHVIARKQSFHGNTLGALAAGGNEWRRSQFKPLLFDTHHVDPCFSYRYQAAGETDKEYAARAATSLEDKIIELGPASVMAFVAETVVGATSGAVPPVADYFKRIRAICDKFGVLLILDEVMCGMGRTGTLHACEQEGIAPDILTIAKGLGGGYQPIGAVLLHDRIFDALASGSGVFQHGQTYSGHPLAAAAALAVQKVLRSEGLIENVRVMGGHLNRRLRERFANSAHVGDIRGRGLFQALEFVSDRATKDPFAPGLKLNARIKAEAMKSGLLVYPMGGTIDGARGDHVLLAPPFIVEREQIDEIVDRLGDAVDAAIVSVK